MTSSHDLQEGIREYWSRRSATFDQSFGHGMSTAQEAAAWAQPLRDHLGPPPQEVLELAYGTGEITQLVHGLGHDVTALDFPKQCLQWQRPNMRANHAGDFCMPMQGRPWNRMADMMRSCAVIWSGP